jgi:hypothetical protein
MHGREGNVREHCHCSTVLMPFPFQAAPGAAWGAFELLRAIQQASLIWV